jgi:hypothetical protein
MKEMTVKAAMDPAAPSHTPTPTVGAKMVATSSGSTPPTKRPYKGI